ncbi:hypothetical protein BDR07DRAFT_1374399 [Suillus spraguei]|nr:hypothetical protein BDR07DRAFT_1374399 [Suillus spraguei]
MSSSSSHGEIGRLAVSICRLIEVARDMPVKDTFPLTTQAGRIVVGDGHVIPRSSLTPLQTESMRLAPGVTAIPPILLSCAMELSTCARVGQDSKIELVRIPNWGAIGYDDHRIMEHPHHKKAMVWMSSTGAAKDVELVKVSSNGIDWQAILHGVVDPGASTSHQSSTEEAVGLHGISQAAKPRTFGPAKRKLVDRKGKGVERKKEGTEPREDQNMEVATENTQQHLSEDGGRKRRRTSYKFANDVESSDDDLRMNKTDSKRSSIGTANISGPSALKSESEKGSSDNGLRMGELLDSERPSNKAIGMANISGSLLKLLAMTAALHQQDQKQTQFLRGMHKKEAKVFLWQGAKDYYGGSRRPRTVSRQVEGAFTGPDKITDCIWLHIIQGDLAVTFQKSPEYHHGIPARWCVVFGLTPAIKLLSVPPIPTPEGTTVDSMEGRLVMLEARLAKLNTVIENIGEVRQSKVSSDEPHPILPAILPSADPYSSAKATLAVQAGAVQPSGAVLSLNETVATERDGNFELVTRLEIDPFRHSSSGYMRSSSHCYETSAL